MANPKLYQKSVFAKYFDADDPAVLAWAENVYQKMVEKGIVANYISRDNDFDQLYEPTCLFFSYLVQLARTFKNFKTDDELARLYLSNKGQYTCGDETLNQLLYLIENQLRIKAQRGSIKMIEESLSGNPHGELLRAICWEYGIDYFKLGVARPQNNSWNLNNSGPLYRGNTLRIDMSSGYEYTKTVEDLSKYPLIQSQYVGINFYRGKKSMHIENVPVNQTAGIGANDFSKRILVNSNANFEISFEIAQDATVENITFGCIALDDQGDEVQLLDAVTGLPRKYFFETRRLNKAGNFYLVRGIIYSKNQSLLSASDATLNIGFGTNLKFSDNVVSIIPIVLMDNNYGDDSEASSDTFDSDSISIDPGDSDSASDESWNDSPYDSQPSIFVYNLKVTICSLIYNRCYLNNKNFIDIVLTNNNGDFSITQINSIFRKHFIPYNTPFYITNITSDGLVFRSYLLLEDGGFMLYEDEGLIELE